MPLLTWNHDLDVGVRAMDDQHSILLETINELRLAVVRGHGREQIAEVFDRLIEFTRMHFWSEEQLLEQAHYARLEEHRAAHHRLLAEMLQRAHIFQYGAGVDSHHLLLFLSNSYMEHMEGVDRDYGVHLNKMGIN